MGAGAAGVLGLGLSERRLERARRDTDDDRVTYRRQELETLDLPRGAVDVAFSSLALHYLSDLDRLLATVARALVPGAALVSSVEHPIMTAPASPGFAEADGRTVWPVDGYLDEGPRTTDWLAPGVDKQHRTITTYLAALRDAGFRPAALVEWGPSPEQVAARPQWAGDRVRPLFLLVRAPTCADRVGDEPEGACLASMAGVNASTLLARLTADALRAVGVRDVVLCPGSRSAPLAYELARRHDVRLHVRHDERVAAFTALGAGGAVVTTSGTAVANLHPAVLEAHHANRPLVVVTADRPPRLRGTWANQTSELQAGLFGGAVRARLDLADTDAAADESAAMVALLEALVAARGPRPGPVHLDLGFTDPLVPDDDDPGESWFGGAGEPPPPVPGVRLDDGPRTVLVAGDQAGPDAVRLARAAAWPLVAEPSSGAAGADAVAAGRMLLELPELVGAVERVVVLGRPTLSRPVTRLVSDPGVELVVVSPLDDWPEPGRVARRVPALDQPRRAPDAWSGRWAAASAAARQALDAVLDAAPAGAPLGPSVARAVARSTRPGQTLVAAASNPVRDLDLVGHALADGVRVAANRGLAGIDGTLSTAAGLALDGGFVRVLVGDVAFLHDLNGLLVPPGEARPHLQVVVLNDDGGGIFSLLEHGERARRGAPEGTTFERVFGTPHGADLGALCAGYRVPHRWTTSVGDLELALTDPPEGSSVVEVRTTREGLRDLHERIRAAVHAAARDAMSQSPLP